MERSDTCNPITHFGLPAKFKSSVESRGKLIASGNCDPAVIRGLRASTHPLPRVECRGLQRSRRDSRGHDRDTVRAPETRRRIAPDPSTTLPLVKLRSRKLRFTTETGRSASGRRRRRNDPCIAGDSLTITKSSLGSDDKYGGHDRNCDIEQPAVHRGVEGHQDRGACRSIDRSV